MKYQVRGGVPFDAIDATRWPLDGVEVARVAHTKLRHRRDAALTLEPRAGSPMFLMQLCSNARHLEVQIVGDKHGQAVALNGRDCSTQRRFQKIFEEGPPVVSDEDVFIDMQRAAVNLCRSLGYQSAGTVEYMYILDTKDYYFLELNPRLQAEHSPYP